MLQIITAKFFQTEKLYETLHRAVFYTNYRIPREDRLETPIGVLLPSTGWRGLGTLTCEVVEKLEAHPDGPKPGVLISTGGQEIINDFAAVVSFGLNVTCTPDPDLARRLTTSAHPALGVSEVPQKYVRRMFDGEVIGKREDAVSLNTFISELLGLERKSFEGAIRAIRRYITGAHRIADDLDLAYVLFVMSIESLAQEFDGYAPEWADYDPRKRATIDLALEGAPADVSDKVREAVLKNEHVALARRFRDFALSHVTPSFFRDEAKDIPGKISRPDLSAALEHAYVIRSRYVHRLREIPRILKGLPYHTEALEAANRPTFTFDGLSRLARHIILQFVHRGKKVEREVFDYRSALPNIVQARLSPEYWVGRPEGFGVKTAPLHLNGFLEQVTQILLRTPGAKVTDVRPILSKIEQIVPGLASRDQRLPSLLIYFLFHQIAPRDFHLPTWPQWFAPYTNDFDTPSVESFVAHLLSDQKPRWPLSELEELHAAYFRGRYRAGTILLGRFLEAAFTLYVAEAQRSEGNEQRARELIAFAVECYPGHQALLEFESSAASAPLPPIDWDVILRPPEPQDSTVTP